MCRSNIAIAMCEVEKFKGFEASKGLLYSAVLDWPVLSYEELVCHASYSRR